MKVKSRLQIRQDNSAIIERPLRIMLAEAVDQGFSEYIVAAHLNSAGRNVTRFTVSLIASAF